MRSVQVFERFCDLNRVAYQRIRVATKPDHKRPDYKVRLAGYGCIVELKQIDPNEDDLRRQTEFRTRGWSVGSRTPGARLRNQIRDAADQLRPWVKRRVPGIVLFFDNTPFRKYLDPYDVKTAMYGLDALRLAVPKDATSQPYSTGWGSGGKATVTDQHNTTVSGIAALCPDPEEGEPPYLVVYHNRHAAVPLDPACVAAVTDYQYRIEGKRPADIDNWVHAVTGQPL